MGLTLRGMTMGQALGQDWATRTTASTQVPATAVVTRPPAASAPFYKRGWFWALVAVAGGAWAWKKFRRGRKSPLG